MGSIRLLRRGLVGLALAVLPVSTALAQTLENVHRSSGGVQANASASSSTPAMSDNGRYVAFASPASNLVLPDPNGLSDIFVRDRATGTTVMITAVAGGANGASGTPSISGDGRYVVFQSSASNLVAGDANGLADIFRYDRDTDADGIFDEPGATAMVLISQSTGGVQGNRASFCTPWAVSDDGNLVTFYGRSNNLAAGDVNFIYDDCFVRNVSAGTTTWVTQVTDGLPGHSRSPSISGNGRFVVFESDAELLPDDTNLTTDIYRYDLQTGTYIRASLTSGGSEVSQAYQLGVVSDDGSVIAFIGGDSALEPADVNGKADVYVRDVNAGVTSLVSVATDGTAADNHCLAPALSGDGNTVAWYTQSGTLTLGDMNNTNDVFVHNRTDGRTVRASRGVGGTLADGSSLLPYLRDDGDEVAFVSAATNLLPITAPDVNGATDVFVRGGPFKGPGSGTSGPPSRDVSPFTRSVNPVSFSVNGPVDPQTEGILFPRGGPIVAQATPQPGNPYGFGIRTPDVPQATGINSPIRPGDVNDYYAAGLPSEAVFFQSEPPSPGFPGGSPPAGTDNQIVESIALGLMPGSAVLRPMWNMAPPLAPPRDNVDALSFGEDYFPPVIMTSAALPELATPWNDRVSVFPEPVVTDDAPGISFQFCVDPWAVGLPGTSVSRESGALDFGLGLGPWSSPEEAAGDIFATPILVRSGGVTLGGGANFLVDDNPSVAAAPDIPPLDLMEDDLDALESVGSSTDWMTGAALTPGSIHDRVTHVAGVGLPPAGASWHDPNAATPIFFSVTRNSPGRGGSAVRSNFVLDGGAGADIFVAAKIPGDPPGVGTNLLFIDQAELGLLPTDDLDGLILWVCPEYRYYVQGVIGAVAANLAGAPMPADSARIGVGMTISITKYLAGSIPPDCIRVGFSVTTDAVGMEYTAVDYEAGPVPGPGPSSAAGDIFYATVDGTPTNPNYLWYQATDLGLDGGAWMNGASTNLLDLSDNLNGLDSDSRTVSGVPRGNVIGIEPELADAVPNPFGAQTRIGFTLPHQGHLRLTVTDLSGRRVATLADGNSGPGRGAVMWGGRADDGKRLTPGVYFVRMDFDGRALNRKLVLVR